MTCRILWVLSVALLPVALASCRCGASARCLPSDPGAISTASSAAVEEERQIFISISAVRIPESLLTEALGTLPAQSSAQVTDLSKAQAKQLLATWSADPAIRTVSGPQILMLENQEASFSSGETIGFARTAVTQGDNGLAFQIEKLGGSVFLGLEVRVTAAVSQNGEHLALHLWKVQREKLRPVTEVELRNMDAATFLRKFVFEHEVDVSFEMANDSYVLLGAPSPQGKLNASDDVLQDAEGRHVRVMLLRAVLMKPTEAVQQRLSSD